MKKWLKETALKTVKTMAQSALGLLTASSLITEIDWVTVASVAALSGVICVLMNVGNLELESGQAEQPEDGQAEVSE